MRELHNKLSHYVRQVADGGEVFVTMRGRRVARLAPLEEGDPLADLRARGLVREPSRPKRSLAGQRGTAASVSDLAAEQRR